MQCHIDKDNITLHLTKSEAIWLKNLVQNYKGNPQDESFHDHIVRKKLWTILMNTLNHISAE